MEPWTNAAAPSASQLFVVAPKARSLRRPAIETGGPAGNLVTHALRLAAARVLHAVFFFFFHLQAEISTNPFNLSKMFLLLSPVAS